MTTEELCRQSCAPLHVVYFHVIEQSLAIYNTLWNFDEVAMAKTIVIMFTGSFPDMGILFKNLAQAHQVTEVSPYRDLMDCRETLPLSSSRTY